MFVLKRTVCAIQKAPVLAKATFRAPGAARFFSDNLTIPTDEEQQFGRRKEELDAAKEGIEGFDHTSSIIPEANAGTKENPILVPSGTHSRTVGYEDPGTHQLVWFNLDEGPLHFIPDINLHFRLKKI